MSAILLRLIPSAPRVGSDFTKDLTGLVIKAFDLTVQDNQSGVPLGTASFTGDNKTSIHQYVTETLRPPPQPPLQVFHSVATAVIIAKPPSGHLEYGSFDLRLEITRGDTESILDETIEYNVNLFQLESNPNDYLKNEPSAYFQLPPASAGLSNVANVQLNPNGQPPDFVMLHDAINFVLKQDHPAVPKDSTLANNSLETLDSPLTPGQASQVASEITWNRALHPAPQSTMTLQGISVLESL